MELTIIFLVLFFVFGVPMLFLIYYFERFEKPLEHARIKAKEIRKEREVIVKEIVLIPCHYCGGFLPQTSLFCPSCGAKRNAK